MKQIYYLYPIHSESIETAFSNSLSVIVRGGRSLILFLAVKGITPFDIHFSTISLAFNPSFNPIPSIKPIPSTLTTLLSFVNLLFIYLDFFSTSFKRLLSIMFNTSKAPAATTGLAPNVEAWSPGTNTSEIFYS